MKIKKPELYNYSPHKPPMLLIDEILDYSFESSGRTMESIVHITPRSMFFDNERDCVPAWVSFEYMAQSLAVLSGIRSVGDEEEPNIGFIIGIRDFESRIDGFRAGGTVRISVRELYKEGSLAAYDCIAYWEEKEAVHAVVNAIEADEELIRHMEGA